jgi:hypothetical protein
MMPMPNVLVCVTGGVVDVEVLTEDIVVEVRDYDIDGSEENLLTDEKGQECTRYFVEG